MKFNPNIARDILLDVEVGGHVVADPAEKHGAGIYERHGVLTREGGLIAGTVVKRRGGVEIVEDAALTPVGREVAVILRDEIAWSGTPERYRHYILRLVVSGVQGGGDSRSILIDRLRPDLWP
ncbi:hypothetical protein ACUSIJ_25020 [Pseudochelatococcus sp. B33]